eukprot:6185801-Pleurochrysis_carterae.AAC.1
MDEPGQLAFAKPSREASIFELHFFKCMRIEKVGACGVQGEWPWGSPSFKSLGPHKIELIYKTISWGFELVITGRLRRACVLPAKHEIMHSRLTVRSSHCRPREKPIYLTKTCSSQNVGNERPRGGWSGISYRCSIAAASLLLLCRCGAVSACVNALTGHVR